MLNGARKAHAAPVLVPTADNVTQLELVKLPKGWSYNTMSFYGDPTTNAGPVSSKHDGGAAFIGNDGYIHYLRNHEPRFDYRTETREYPGVAVYDAGGAYGGITDVVIDPKTGRHVRTETKLLGTAGNCSGGPMPWGAWLTCEEDMVNAGGAPPSNLSGPAREKDHGFVFEVPLDGEVTAQPLKEMGRFNHEAVVIDPKSGFLYMTEDKRFSGIYRFKPAVRQGKKAIPAHHMRAGDLAKGGKLSMLRIVSHPNAQTQAWNRLPDEDPPPTFTIDWVDIDDPLLRDGPGTSGISSSGELLDGPEKGVFSQGWAKGGASFRRGEGMWYSKGKIYFTATDGGPASRGQVWELEPDTDTLRLIFVSPGTSVLALPDNLISTPGGGLLLCEDHSSSTHAQRLIGLRPDGSTLVVAENNYIVTLQDVVNMGRDPLLFGFTPSSTASSVRRHLGAEWAGASFIGDWLIVSLYEPGVTLTIKGDWAALGL
jgi:secreted PhoX family phosphatase